LRAICLATTVVALAAIATPAANASTASQNRAVICKVFGSYCSQAIEVSRCETGGTFSLWAENGQYLGLFQMGSSERRIYGHANHAWGQVRAAYRYFVASGKDWSPWTCKPW
jgi:hypothetical protein